MSRRGSQGPPRSRGLAAAAPAPVVGPQSGDIIPPAEFDALLAEYQQVMNALYILLERDYMDNVRRIIINRVIWLQEDTPLSQIFGIILQDDIIRNFMLGINYDGHNATYTNTFNAVQEMRRQILNHMLNDDREIDYILNVFKASIVRYFNLKAEGHFGGPGAEIPEYHPPRPGFLKRCFRGLCGSRRGGTRKQCCSHKRHNRRARTRKSRLVN